MRSARICRVRLMIVTLALLASPGGAAAQAGVPTADEDPSSPHRVDLDLGVLSAALSYAYGLGGSDRLAVGGNLWGAWEPWNTFDRPVWEPFGAGLFLRFHPSRSLTGEIGTSAARYLWADDCSECTGRLLLIRGALLLGWGRFAVGPEVSLGEAHDDRYGSDAGVLYGLVLRLRLVPW